MSEIRGKKKGWGPSGEYHIDLTSPDLEDDSTPPPPSRRDTDRMSLAEILEALKGEKVTEESLQKERDDARPSEEV